jgi:integrase
VPTPAARIVAAGQARGRVGQFQKMLKRLFRLAEMSGHAHRFRDTFAVELLSKNVPIEHVSILLGHASTKITEKHYSPWVAARQEQLEDSVRKTWATTPAAKPEHAKSPAVRRTKSRTFSEAIAERQ